MTSTGTSISLAPSTAPIGLGISHRTIILLLLVAMFVADGMNAVLINLGASITRVSIFVRLIAEIYFLALLAFKARSGYLFALIGFFFFVFVLGTLAAVPAYEDYAFLDNLVNINKLILVFICWATFLRYFNTSRAKALLFRVFEGLMLAQSTVVILSFTFDWTVFAPYSEHGRFGYAGLIPAVNEVSGVMVIAFFYFFTKLIYSERGSIGLVVTTVSGLMTGTRALLILPVILLFWVGPRVVRRRIKKSYALIGIAVLSAAVIAWFGGDYLYGRVEKSIVYFQYEAKDVSPWIVFFGSRLVGVSNFVVGFLPKFGVLNYLFGGHDLVALSTETDLVDVFIRLGLIGGVAFWIFYVRLLVLEGGRVSAVRVMFALTWLGIAVTAGHLVFSAINGVYLAILLLALSTRAPQAQQGPANDSWKDLR